MALVRVRIAPTTRSSGITLITSRSSDRRTLAASDAVWRLSVTVATIPLATASATTCVTSVIGVATA